MSVAFLEDVRQLNSKRKGKQMQQMIELYEMVSMNDTSLRGTEKMSILKARLALQMFERAMQSFVRRPRLKKKEALETRASRYPHGQRRLLDVASAANEAAAVINIGTADLNHDAAGRGRTD